MGESMTTILENARRMQRGEAPPPPIGRLLGFVLKVIEPPATKRAGNTQGHTYTTGPLLDSTLGQTLDEPPAPRCRVDYNGLRTPSGVQHRRAQAALRHE